MWTVSDFGTTKEGKDVKRYTARNDGGVEISIIEYGATIISINAPDNKGNIQDVVGGYDDLAGYEGDTLYLGTTVGRYANRIAEGKFTLDGKEYQLAINNDPNHLHGGIVGFNKKVWNGEIDGNRLKLTYTSVDGEEGYPGKVDVCVSYELQPDNTLVLDFVAKTDSATIVNLTNHSYFNLAGHDSGKIYDHTVQISAERYTPVNDVLIPTGELASVAGTIFDLRQPVSLGDVLHKVPGGGGYDHNYCLNVEGSKKHIGRVEHKASGRFLDMHTTQPGVQFYTSHYLGASGKAGATYSPYGSLCLEPQNYPDAVNQETFPNCVLRPGETYHHTIWYHFGVEKSN